MTWLDQNFQGAGLEIHVGTWVKFLLHSDDCLLSAILTSHLEKILTPLNCNAQIFLLFFSYTITWATMWMHTENIKPAFCYGYHNILYIFFIFLGLKICSSHSTFTFAIFLWLPQILPTKGVIKSSVLSEIVLLIKIMWLGSKDLTIDYQLGKIQQSFGDKVLALLTLVVLAAF